MKRESTSQSTTTEKEYYASSHCVPMNSIFLVCVCIAFLLFCCCLLNCFHNWHAPNKQTRRTTTRHHCNYWFVLSVVNWQNNTISSILFSVLSFVLFVIPVCYDCSPLQSTHQPKQIERNNSEWEWFLLFSLFSALVKEQEEEEREKEEKGVHSNKHAIYYAALQIAP